MKRPRSLAVSASAILVLTTPASADVSSEQKVAAQALFNEGRELVKRGRFAEACPKLSESLRAEPGIGTMLWLADCYENVGRTASAWMMFRDAASIAARQKDARQKVARRRMLEIEPGLTSLVIVVPPIADISGLVIARDGVDVAPADIGVPIPIDPGIHTLSAVAPGRERWSTTIDLGRRPGPVAVTVPLLRSLEATAPARVVVAPRSAVPSTEVDSGSALRSSGLVVAGVGALAIGAGAVLGLVAKSAYDRSNEDGHCVDDRCDAFGKDRRMLAFDLATGSTIAFAAGATALVTGGVLRFVIAPRRGGAQGATTVVPVITGDRGALMLTRRF